MNQAQLEKLLARRVLARRRLLQFTRMTHPSYDAGWVHEDICRRLEKFSKDVADQKSPRLMLLMPPRHGKLTAHSTLVPTPQGMRTHGELRAGDTVFHPSGRPVTVLAVSAEDVADWEVRTSAGAVVKCHAEHEWTVFDRANGKWRTVTTAYLAAQTVVSDGRNRFQLPTTEALQCPEAKLPIDPYFLGAWLGDGASAKPVLCGSVADMAHIVARMPYELGHSCIHAATGVAYQYFKGGVCTLLRVYGLLKNKHIPEKYMFASESQRRALLAGLVDTDGSVEPGSQRVRFRTGSQALAEQVAFLARTLGYRASIDWTPADTRPRAIVGGESWCVQWTPHDGQGGGTLPRKVVSRARTRRAIGIVSVTQSESPEKGCCIQVDAPDGMYLVGKHLVPTHNSELASIRFPAWHLGHHPDHELINVGYNLDLPMVFSRKVRELVRDPVYQAIFPQSHLDPQSQSVEKWTTKEGGGFTAAGVGGGITGKGAHILIIDDPIKNQEEADSINTRDNLWDWYQSTAYTRLAPGGGILVIECMTGDTPVLLASGLQLRLDQVRPGDEVATYEDGQLSTTLVSGWKISGRDFVYKITMESGRVVRANARHPFLVQTDTGCKWIRVRDLTTASRIVALPVNGVSGGANFAQSMGAASQSSAGDTASRTTVRKNGPTDTALLQSIPNPAALQKSSTATVSLPKSTNASWPRRAANALYVTARRLSRLLLRTGSSVSASTTATIQVQSAGCSATAATSLLGTPEQSASPSPWPNISDFTLDRVLSIEPVGVRNVYDLRIAGTSNFIANGLVSHNTWWNDDDLAGRLQGAMGANPEADQFEIVKYPALSEAWEYRDEVSGLIVRLPEEDSAPDITRTLLRPKDFCLHEGRYPTAALKKIRANLQPRIWSALYQQNPVPDEGMYFRREYFKYEAQLPDIRGLNVFTAWDFAIGEKQVNDWTVGATILQDENDVLHVLEIFRMKGDSFQIVEAILDTALRWGSTPSTGYLIGAEDGQIWRAIEPLLKKRMIERKQFPPYQVLRPLTDKMARARPLQGRMQQGRVVFHQHAGWLPQMEQELLRFPAGVHDDVVDALAWAVHLCMGKEPPKLYTAPPLPSWKDKLALHGSSSLSHMAA